MNVSWLCTVATKLTSNLWACIRQRIASRSWVVFFSLCSYYWDSSKMLSQILDLTEQERDEFTGVSPVKGHKDDLWSLIWGKAESWACSVWKEAGSEESQPRVKISDVTEWWGGSTTPLSGVQWDCEQKASQDGQWAQTKMYKILPEHKKTFTEKMIKQWSRLPRKVVESLKILFDCSWHHLTLRKRMCTLRDPWQNDDDTNCS